MKIGFEDVPKKEQGWNKRLYLWDHLLFNATFLILKILIIASYLVTAYFGVRVIIYGEDLSRMLGYLYASLLLTSIPIFQFLLRKLIWWIQKRTIIISPELEKSGRKEKGGDVLTNVLLHMHGKPMRLAWDLIIGMFLIMLLVLILAGGVSDPLRSKISFLIFSIIFVAVHFLLTFYYHTRLNIKTLLEVTQTYLTIPDPQNFEQVLSKSFNRGILFCSMQFCFTQDFFVGYSGTDFYFNPAAIPAEEIDELEFYINKENGRATIDKGILACKLKNGKVVPFYIGSGIILQQALYALDYYHIQYTKNNEPIYTINNRRV